MMSTQSRDLFKNVQSNLIHNSPNLERTQMSMDERMNKHIVVQSYYEITLSQRTKQTTKPQDNMGDPPNHYTEQNERKITCTAQFYSYEVQEQATCIKVTESEKGCSGYQGELIAKEQRELSEVVEMFSLLFQVVVTWVYSKHCDLCILVNGNYTSIFKPANKIISFKSRRVATWFAQTKAAQVLQPGTWQHNDSKIHFKAWKRDINTNIE